MAMNDERLSHLVRIIDVINLIHVKFIEGSSFRADTMPRATCDNEIRRSNFFVTDTFKISLAHEQFAFFATGPAPNLNHKYVRIEFVCDAFYLLDAAKKVFVLDCVYIGSRAAI